jgi:hypothetical protein
MPVLRIGSVCDRCRATGVRPPRRVASEHARGPERYCCVQHLALLRITGPVRIPTHTPRGET